MSWNFCVWLKLSCYQFKIDYHCKVFYVISMETTKKTPMEDRAKKIRKESKHLPQKKTPSKTQRNKRGKEGQNSYKTDIK